MKHKTKWKWLVLPVSLMLMGCPPRINERQYTEYTPILLSRSDLNKSIEFQQPREIATPGKIYVYENYLFVGELNRGVHVFDNSTPENPVNIGYLRIPGNEDISIKNGILYADNAVDLVTINLQDVNNPVLVKRTKNVFPEVAPPDQLFIPRSFEKSNRPSDDMIIVGWEKN